MTGKNVKKIFTSALCAIVIFLGTVCGRTIENADRCFAAPRQVEAENTIKIGTWYLDSDLLHLKAFLAKQFPETEIEFVYIARSNYESIIDSQLSYRGAPDIIYVDQEMAQKHAASGYISDITELGHNFREDAQRAFSYNDRVYAVPNTSQFSCIYYNKSLFEEKGVEVPSDLDTFVGACDFFRVVRKIEPLAASLREPYDASDFIFSIYAADYFNTARGASFGTRRQSGETSFTDEMERHNHIIRRLTQHYIVTADMYAMDKESAVKEFVDWDAAMIYGGPEEYNAIIRADPSMRLGTIPMFGSSKTSKAFIGGCDCGFALNKYATNTEMAWQILRAISEHDGQEALWKDRPGSQTYLNGVKFFNGTAFEGLNEMIQARKFYLPWRSFGQDLCNPIRYNLGKETQKIILGKVSTVRAMQNIDAAIDDILRYGP